MGRFIFTTYLQLTFFSTSNEVFTYMFHYSSYIKALLS